jgi:cell division protein FtsI/penicillin-binding protein 2
LDAGIVTLDSAFDCEDGLWFYRGRSLRDSGHRYGVLRVWEIIQKSSNIGTAKIALLMGERRVFDTLTNFGFGKPTGLGLEGEAPGIFRPLEKWDALSISRFPIGQGILVTPLQMLQAYCTLANGGLMRQLRVIDRLVDPVSGRADVYPNLAKWRVVREDAVQKIVQALKLVAREGGTAPKAAVPGYDVAGKTGTAQKVIDGQYSTTKFVASFIGFVPADDPAFVLLVAADEPDPKRGYYGGTVAAPTFSRIAEKTLRYLQIAPLIPNPRPMPVEPEPTVTPENEEADFTPVP